MREAFRFGVFELDPDEAELRKAGRRVRLAPQPFAVLTYLVRHAGRLVSREELIPHIWGDVVVDHDAGLKSCLKQIRRALADPSSSPRYVETVPKHGYRFVAPVTRSGRTPAARPRTGVLAAMAALATLSLGAGLWLSAGRTVEGVPSKSIATDPEATGAFLKGLYLVERGKDLEARRELERAVALAPTHARAHEALASVVFRSAFAGVGPPQRELAVARRHAELALARDAELADALVTRALTVWLSQWDWHAAERDFERAVAAAPGNPRVHQQYAFLLAGTGRHDRALERIESARRLDPLSVSVNEDTAWVHFFAGRFEQAVAEAKHTLELKPDAFTAWYCLAAALQQSGRTSEARQAYREMSRAAGVPSAVMGARPEGGSPVTNWWADPERTDGPALPLYDHALICMYRGDLDQAFELLERSRAAVSGWVAMVAVDPRLEPLRGDPRYRQLLERMNL